MIRTLSLLCCLFALASLFTLEAQEYSLSTESKKARKYYHLAEAAYRQGDYQNAEKNLGKALRADDQFIEAWLLLGDASLELGREDAAMDAFQSAIMIDSAFFPRVFYFMGNLSYRKGEYDSAVSHYDVYLRYPAESALLLEKAVTAREQALFASHALANPAGSTPVNAGPVINSPDDDYINYLSVGEQYLVMTRKIPRETDQHQRVIYTEGFYTSSATAEGWQPPELLDLPWAEGMNLGGMNISVDGTKMYFTGCNWPGGFGSCDIYVSYSNGGVWEQPANLGTLVNSQWWDSQPFISANGKQLFFSSRRVHGKGNTDIWMSVRQADGKWSTPINLGDSINTAGSEMAPFLHPDGRTLYFSSDGHNGLGGYDLFVSRKDETGRWSRARNLGFPLNSRHNEINMVVDLQGDTAWISSDRPGGAGKMDLYSAGIHKNMKPQQVSFLRGVVLDSVSRKPLKAFVELSNLTTGLNEDSSFSDRSNGEFLMVLQPGLNYAFNISAEGYAFHSENLNLKGIDQPEPVEKIFLLSPIRPGVRIVMENIYFDFNSSGLLPSSYIELNKLREMMEKSPSLRIRVEGHTDIIGSDEYNLELSRERAGSVVQYLVSGGIDPTRLEWTGYGSSRPLASNDTEEGRALNRRTEILILKQQ